MERLSALISGFVVAGYTLAFLLKYPNALSVVLSMAAAAWVGSRVPGAAAALQRRWPIPRRLWPALVVGTLSLGGTAHAQMTLGIDTRGVDAVAAQAATVNPAAVQTADNQRQAQPQAQPAVSSERVPLTEVNSVAREMAFGIASKRAERLAWLYNPAQQGLWNVGPYLGVMMATLEQCSLKEGCAATTQDSLRKPSSWTALGLELRIVPFSPFKIDIVQLVARVGADLLNGQIAGLSSGTALSYSGEARLVLLGIVHVGGGYAGQMTAWGVQGTQGGVEQRSATQHYGQFSAGASLRGVTLTGECKVGSWAGFNLDRANFGSVAGYCGTVLSAMVY